MTSDLPGQPGYSNTANTQSPNSLGHSAAARFERFFPSSPNGTSSNPSSAGQTFTSSVGSAAGLAANSAFGSFGHSLAPGSTNGSSIGSGHFGSSNNSGVRKASSRAAIPSQWSNQDLAALNPPSGASPPKNSMPSLQGYQQQDFASSYMPLGSLPGDDDVIPTAIVVKNIPFSVKREQLLQIIEDLGIPMPYAFNYHMDQGVFRGLAFANFRSSEEADAVVAALNGFDVSGRKLRVEYKKVLQAGEKERIEKEKAIKRMQSMQLEKERERERCRQQDSYAANAYLMPGFNGSNGHLAGTDGYSGADQMQQSYNGSLQQAYEGGMRAPLTADSLKKVPSSQRLAAAVERPTGPSSSTSNPGAGASGSPTGGASGGKKEELNLNDAATLEIYSRVLLFKDDRMRDELSFSRSLTPLERRTVHLVAQRLGLFHYSMGEGDERYVIVTKNEVSGQARPLRSQASTIGRTHRSTGLDVPNAGGFLGPGSAATTGRAGLRLKKSAPDMNVSTTGYGASNYLGSPNGSLARKSNSNMRDGYSSTMGRRTRESTGGAAGLQNLFASPFDSTPAYQEGGSVNSSPTHPNLIRQPRGPPTPGSDMGRNFAVRSRVPTNSSSSGNGGGSPPSNGFQLQINGSPTKALGDLEATTHQPLEF